MLSPYIPIAIFIVVATGFALFTLVIGINLLGDGLHDALNPRVGK